jgi:hypothetical protein
VEIDFEFALKERIGPRSAGQMFGALFEIGQALIARSSAEAQWQPPNRLVSKNRG